MIETVAELISKRAMDTHKNNINDEELKYLQRRKSFLNNPFVNFATIPHNKQDSESIQNKLKDLISNENKEDSEYITSCFDSFRPFTENKDFTELSDYEVAILKKFFDSYSYKVEFDLDFTLLRKDLNEFTSVKIGEDLVPAFDKYISNPKRFTERKKEKKKSLKNLSVLVTGEIGSGKSTFMRHIANGMLKRNYKPEEFNYRSTIVIDFEKELKATQNTETLSGYIDNIANNIKSKIRKNANEALSKNKNKKMTQVIMGVFLDNVDIVYQKFCEEYFFKDTEHKFIDIYIGLIEKLSDPHFINFPILIFSALRPESLFALKKRNIGEKVFLEEYYMMTFQINKLSDSMTKKVIEKRIELFRDTIDEEKNKKLYDIVDGNLTKFIESDKICFEEINSISTEGLRNTIDLFFRISPAIFSENLFKRFFLNNHYIRKLHYLGNDFVFSQVEDGVFNIFLNNRMYRESLNSTSKYTKLTNDYKTKEIIKKISSFPHLQTYWQKYFILIRLYYDYLHKDIMQPQNLSQLISGFSMIGSSNKYEENLVRLVLLGLSEVTHGRLLDIKLSDEDTIKNVELTKKAIYLLEYKVWTFDYLSIVLEDIWLQFPRDILIKCPILHEKTHGYCYIENEEKFKEEQKKVFLIKVKKVKLFVKILQSSYEQEVKKVRDVYNELIEINKYIKDADGKFSLPDFDVINKNLNDEIIEKAKLLKLDTIDRGVLKDMELCKSIKSTNTDQILSDFFKTNYLIEENDELSRVVYFENSDNNNKGLNLPY